MTEETKPKAVRKKKSESEGAGEKPTVLKAEKIRAIPSGNKYYGTGRRKEAVAKVWLVAGSGKITINQRSMSQYFANRKLLEYYVNRPLVATQNTDKYDVYAFVEGGGVPGQAGAVSLGIARALVEINPDLKTVLKRVGLMTRDPRMKERKKYGLKRARRAFQYSKR